MREESSSTDARPSLASAIVIVIATVLRIIAGLVFLYAGLSKLQQPYDFLATIYDYQLIGPPSGRYLAMVLPHIEIVTAVCLLGGVMTRSALLLAGLLAIIFLAAQGSVLLRGLLVDCGCFGTSVGTKVSAATLVRTCAVALAIVVAFLLSLKSRTQLYR